MVHALKMGWMKPTKAKTEEEEEENFYMLWKEDEEVLDYQYLSPDISTSLSGYLYISLDIFLSLSNISTSLFRYLY